MNLPPKQIRTGFGDDPTSGAVTPTGSSPSGVSTTTFAVTTLIVGLLAFFVGAGWGSEEEAADERARKRGWNPRTGKPT